MFPDRKKILYMPYVTIFVAQNGTKWVFFQSAVVGWTKVNTDKTRDLRVKLLRPQFFLTFSMKLIVVNAITSSFSIYCCFCVTWPRPKCHWDRCAEVTSELVMGGGVILGLLYNSAKNNCMAIKIGTLIEHHGGISKMALLFL